MVVDPVMTLAAPGDRGQLVEARRVLITYHHIGLVTAQASATHQLVVVSRRRERLREQQPALKIVDVVVHAGPQVDHPRDDARVLVANLDAHALGARQDVLMVQEVERSARSPEFLIARQRSRFGGEAVHGDPSLAELGGGFGPVVRVGSVQTAVDMGHLVAHVAGVEIAPHPVILATARFEVELAQSRSHFCHDTVVAERRVVVIRIDTPEQRIGRFVEEVAEEVLHRSFASIRACRQSPALAGLAVHVERQPAIQRRIVGLRCVGPLQQTYRSARAVPGQGEIGDADVKEVSALELQVAKIQRAVTRIVEHRDFNRMRAVRKDPLRDEVALRVDRNLAARHPNRVVCWYAAALYRHRAAAEGNLVARQVALAIGGQQLARRRRVGRHEFSNLIGRWLAVQPQRMRTRFVEISLRVISAQKVLELAGPARELKYLLRAYDSKGNFDETGAHPLWLYREPSPNQIGKLVTSDASSPRELLAAYGESDLARHQIPLGSGTVTVQGSGIPTDHTVWVAGRQIPIDPQGNFVAERILPDGTHTVEVAVLDDAGNGSLYLRDLEFKRKDLFYIGVADITLSGNRARGPVGLLQGANAPQPYDSSLDGRLAFYVNGKVSERWRIAASADTREGPVKDLFSNFLNKAPDSLFRRIDPDYHYPTFGDDSIVEEVAPTLGKFYVKLSHNDNHAMWGNFKTNYVDNELAQVDRGLYGANAHYGSESTTQFGERRITVDGFAAEPGTLSSYEEFRGTGGSLYFLHHQDILTGSESVRIEIRDKASGIVTGVVNLRPNVDYDIDYLQGRLLLSQPLSSTANDNLLVRN